MQCISGLDKASLRPSAIFTFDIKSCRFLFVNYGCLVEGLNIFLPPSFTASALFPSTQEQLERGGRMDFQCHINLPPPHQPSYFHPKKHKLTTLLFSKNIPQNLKPTNFVQNSLISYFSSEHLLRPRFEIKRLKFPVLTSGRGLKWGKLKTTTKKSVNGENEGKFNVSLHISHKLGKFQILKHQSTRICKCVIDVFRHR